MSCSSDEWSDDTEELYSDLEEVGLQIQSALTPHNTPAPPGQSVPDDAMSLCCTRGLRHSYDYDRVGRSTVHLTTSPREHQPTRDRDNLRANALRVTNTHNSSRRSISADGLGKSNAYNFKSNRAASKSPQRTSHARHTPTTLPSSSRTEEQSYRSRSRSPVLVSRPAVELYSTERPGSYTRPLSTISSAFADIQSSSDTKTSRLSTSPRNSSTLEPKLYDRHTVPLSCTYHMSKYPAGTSQTQNGFADDKDENREYTGMMRYAEKLPIASRSRSPVIRSRSHSPSPASYYRSRSSDSVASSRAKSPMEATSDYSSPNNSQMSLRDDTPTHIRNEDFISLKSDLSQSAAATLAMFDQAGGPQVDKASSLNKRAKSQSPTRGTSQRAEGKTSEETKHGSVVRFDDSVDYDDKEEEEEEEEDKSVNLDGSREYLIRIEESGEAAIEPYSRDSAAEATETEHAERSEANDDVNDYHPSAGSEAGEMYAGDVAQTYDYDQQDLSNGHPMGLSHVQPDLYSDLNCDMTNSLSVHNEYYDSGEPFVTDYGHHADFQNISDVQQMSTDVYPQLQSHIQTQDSMQVGPAQPGPIPYATQYAEVPQTSQMQMQRSVPDQSQNNASYVYNAAQSIQSYPAPGNDGSSTPYPISHSSPHQTSQHLATISGPTAVQGSNSDQVPFTQPAQQVGSPSPVQIQEAQAVRVSAQTPVSAQQYTKQDNQQMQHITTNVQDTVHSQKHIAASNPQAMATSQMRGTASNTGVKSQTTSGREQTLETRERPAIHPSQPATHHHQQVHQQSQQQMVPMQQQRQQVPVKQQQVPIQQQTAMQQQQQAPIQQQQVPIQQQQQPPIQQQQQASIQQQQVPIQQQQQAQIQQQQIPVQPQQVPAQQQKLPVQQQQLPVQQHQIPVHQQQQPILQQKLPVQQQQRPVQRQLAPVQQQQVPVQQQQVPVQRQQVPVQQQQQVPVQQQQVPVQRQQVPVQRQQVPVQQQQVPVQQQQMLPQQQQIPIQQQQAPVQQQQVPVQQQQVQAPQQKVPVQQQQVVTQPHPSQQYQIPHRMRQMQPRMLPAHVYRAPQMLNPGRQIRSTGQPMANMMPGPRASTQLQPSYSADYPQQNLNQFVYNQQAQSYQHQLPDTHSEMYEENAQSEIHQDQTQNEEQNVTAANEETSRDHRNGDDRRESDEVDNRKPEVSNGDEREEKDAERGEGEEGEVADSEIADTAEKEEQNSRRVLIEQNQKLISNLEKEKKKKKSLERELREMQLKVLDVQQKYAISMTTEHWREAVFAGLNEKISRLQIELSEEKTKRTLAEKEVTAARGEQKVQAEETEKMREEWEKREVLLRNQHQESITQLINQHTAEMDQLRKSLASELKAKITSFTEQTLVLQNRLSHKQKQTEKSLLYAKSLESQRVDMTKKLETMMQSYCNDTKRLLNIEAAVDCIDDGGGGGGGGDSGVSGDEGTAADNQHHEDGNGNNGNTRRHQKIPGTLASTEMAEPSKTEQSPPHADEAPFPHQRCD